MLCYDCSALNETILVLDSDTSTLEPIRTTLAGAGYTVVAATSVERSHRRLQEGTLPDLLLVEARQGPTAEIRKRYALPMVLLLDAEDSVDDRTPGPCTYGFVRKSPLDRSLLLATVATVLRRARTERDLRTEEQSYRFFFQNIPVAAIVSDAAYNIQQWNRGAEELFGYTRDQVVGRELTGVLASDKNVEPASQLKQTLLNTLQVNRKSRNQNYDRTRDGRDILCEWHDFPYRKDGLDLILSVARDITGEHALLSQLQSTIELKDFLMQEIYHRLKNNLNMIISLINLKMGELEAARERTGVYGEPASGAFPAQAINVLQDIRQKISAFSILYEMLHQHGGSVRLVDTGTYLRELLDTIFSSASGVPIRLECELLPVEVEPQTAIVLGLITNEIATNAVKHGFSDDHGSGGGTSEGRIFSVQIRAVRDEPREYEFRLRNNGRPFPEDVDLDSAATLGLQLIQNLVSQLKGTVALEKEPSTTFTIRVPL